VTPTDLRANCNALNGEHGTGGRSKLARLLGWHYSTLWRKLNGKSPITLSDDLAIWQVFATLPPYSSARQGTPGT